MAGLIQYVSGELPRTDYGFRGHDGPSRGVPCAAVSTGRGGTTALVEFAQSKMDCVRMQYAAAGVGAG